MFLPQRNGLLEKFSSYLTIDSQGRLKWSTDPTVKRNLQSFLDVEMPAQEPPKPEELALQFRLQILENPQNWLAKLCLIAYLQEPAYRASQKIQNLRGLDSIQTTLSQRDAFSLVSEILTSSLFHILDNYKPISNKTLAFWTKYKLEFLVKQSLRRGREQIKYTNAGLLKVTTQRALEKALEAHQIYKSNLGKFVSRDLQELLTQVETILIPIEEALKLHSAYGQVCRDRHHSIPKLNRKTIAIILQKVQAQNSNLCWTEELVRSQLEELENLVERTSSHFQYIEIWKIYCNIAFNDSSSPEPPKIKKHPWPPSSTKLEKVANLYNQQRSYPKIIAALNSKAVLNYLEQCATFIRNRDRFLEVSYEISPSFERDTRSVNLSDEFHEKISDCDISTIQSFVSSQIQALPPEKEWLLRLLFSIELTQNDIAAILNLKQYQVSRKKQAIQTSLLRAFTQFIQREFDLELTPQLIAESVAPLYKQILEMVWQAELEAHLKTFTKINLSNELEWLKKWDKLLWECEGDRQQAIQKISNIYSCKPQDSCQKLMYLEAKLYHGLQEIYQSQLDRANIVCNLEDLPSSAKAFQNKVSNWLETTHLNTLI